MTNTCGYICPQCGGSGYTDEGLDCHWCKPLEDNLPTDEEWMQSTHEGCGCGGKE